MENTIVNAKLELIEWISQTNNSQLITKLIQMKNDEDRATIAEAHSEYLVKDSFEEQWERGLALEESRTASKEKIRGWWGR